MLLIVAESSGSSPGRQGFKMIVGPNDYIHGSIGGGIMEIKLVELAKSLLLTGAESAFIKKQIHNKASAQNQSGMICSGEQTVLYFKLTCAHLGEIENILIQFNKHLSATLQISFSNNVAAIAVDDDQHSGDVFVFEKNSDTEFSYREIIGYRSIIYIVGGGHCSLALSELLSHFDFYIQVVEDRPALNTLTQNDFAHEKHILEKYEEIDRIIPSGKNIFVVIMTLGYRSDIQVLQHLSGKSFAYLGVLGSEAKIIKIKEELRLSGYPEPGLNEMHAPIGIKIGSHTPEEIAVSIMAEIIKVRNA